MDKKDLTKLSRKSEITNKIVLVMCYIVIAVVLFCLFLPLFLTIICMFKNKQEIFPTEFHTSSTQMSQ